MKASFLARLGIWLCPAVLIATCSKALSAPVALNTNLQIRLVLNTTNSSGVGSVRLKKDPRNNQLYYLKLNGDIYQVNLQEGNATTSAKVYSAANHGLANNVEGMAIGANGTIYIVGNDNTNNTTTFARISKGVPDAGGVRGWSLLARTEPYPRTGLGIFDHLFNGAVVSADGQFLFVNSGARTDHGEIESAGGLYPNTRDVALTTKIFRLPTSSSNVVLTNDLNALRQAGYIFAEGVRNAFSLAFGPSGDLFATDNGPDRDMPESLYWLRQGLHFGFSWRMGGMDNPQQFPTYDPSTDKLLDPRYYAVAHGLYQNDPTFPPPPTNFAAPIVNLGPDASNYRDPTDGSIKNAASLGQVLGTFTAHRSPLGLVFDVPGAMAAPFAYHGFMVSWTPGDPTGDTIAGPFEDASQDLIDLGLTKLGNTNYQTTVTRIVGGFSNPVDAEVIGNRLYVLENGGNQGLWEITFPPSSPNIILTALALDPGNAFSFTVTATPGLAYEIDASSNLVNWSVVSNVIPSSSQFQFTDSAAVSAASKFYRVREH